MQADKPILFQPALVRATLAGIKTQTRRLIKLKAGLVHGLHCPPSVLAEQQAVAHDACPYGRPAGRTFSRWAFSRPRSMTNHRAFAPALARTRAGRAKCFQTLFPTAWA